MTTSLMEALGLGDLLGECCCVRAAANSYRTPMQVKLDRAKNYLRAIGGARPGVLARWMRTRGVR